MDRKVGHAVSGKQVDNFQKETHVVSVMIQCLETDVIRNKKENRLLLHQKRRHRLTGRYPRRVQAAEERALLEQEERFRAEISLGERKHVRHVIFGTLPCVSISSLHQDANVATNVDSSAMLRLMGSPVKSRRKVVGGIRCVAEGVHTLGLCVSR